MMKRILLFSVIVAAYTSLYALTPQEIQGRWVSSDMTLPASTPDEVVKMKCDYDFTSPQDVKVKYEMKYNIKYERKLTVDAYYEILAAGKYTCSSDSIIIILDISTMECKISEDDIRVHGIGLEDGMDQRNMQQQFAAMLRESTQAQETETERADVLTDVVIDGKKMVCRINDMQMQLKRKK